MIIVAPTHAPKDTVQLVAAHFGKYALISEMPQTAHIKCLPRRHTAMFAMRLQMAQSLHMEQSLRLAQEKSMW